MKTNLTKMIENSLWQTTKKIGTYGCFEVTLPNGGRVDYMTFDTKGIFRCYEIKVSKSDFSSINGHNFLGHYNYYAVPQDLYNEIKNEISNEIGVFIFGEGVKKKPKRQVNINTDMLKNCMIRSLYRDVVKGIESGAVDEVTYRESEISRLKNQLYEEQRQRKKYNALIHVIIAKFNLDRQWIRENLML